MDPDVVEIPPPIAPPPLMFNHKEVTLGSVIEIDDDEDFDGLMFFDKVVDRKNKGKSKMFLSDGYNDRLVEEARVNNKVESSSSFFPGAPNIINIDDNSSDESCDFADEYIDLSVDDYMDIDQYAMLQAHFDNSDIPTGIEAPVPFLLDPHQSNKKPVTRSNSVGLHTLNLSSPSNLTESVQHICSKSAATRSTGHHAKAFPMQLDDFGPHRTNPSSSSRIAARSSSSGLTVVGVDSASQPNVVDELSPSIHSQPAQSKKKVSADMQHKGLGVLSKSRWRPFQNRKKQVNTSSSTNHDSVNQKIGRNVKHPAVVDPFIWDPVNLPTSDPFLPDKLNKQIGKSSFDGFVGPAQFVTGNPLEAAKHLPDVVGPPLPWSHQVFQIKNFNSSSTSISAAQSNYEQWAYASQGMADVPWWESSHHTLNNEPAIATSESAVQATSSVDKAAVLKKFQVFKQFETVEDHSDHQYKGNGSSTKLPSKTWAKRIQEEWKILEKNLPDNIFVRVYESRMDILRFAIVGAEGTPYHDGLFFFDVFFPNSYPNAPPHVHYHSGGLRLNPNLYDTGKVCLSLLNTWSGSKNEKWIPGTSTMLQVLVSIQALILNAKPYFNEPGYAHSAGTPDGELRSLQYNENTFILSLKTMTYSIKRPPKHFEDFVMGHFLTHAHDILVACKAYLGGAQVGCLVRGGVQDVDEGDQSCSRHFKISLASFMRVIISEFSRIGVEDCDKYLPPPAVNAGIEAGRASRTGLKMLAISG